MDWYIAEELFRRLALDSPTHLGWLIMSILGVALAVTKSRKVGALLMAAALCHGLMTILSMVWLYLMISGSIDPTSTVLTGSFTLLTMLLGALKYMLLLGAVWVER